MKKVYVVTAITSLVFMFLAFAFHRTFLHQEEGAALKIGFIYVGDSSTPYTDNFIESQEELQNTFGDKIEIVTLYNVQESNCEPFFRKLVEEDCKIIFSNSYGYSSVCKALAAEFPEIQFCQATGDNANTDVVLKNYHNFMGSIYEGRYITGVVAGLKIKEQIDQGVYEANQAKIGYVAAFPFAEVISGYTAFYMGVQSIVPEATMLVQYVNTWSNFNMEKLAATNLIKHGCVLISQHSDTYGPAVACENANMPYTVYHVGYNQSMTEVAPTCSLVSCGINFSPYIISAVSALLDEKTIESCVDATVIGQDSVAGLSKGWVRILDVNEAIAAPGTMEAIASVREKLDKKELTVYQGEFTGTDPFDATDTIDLREGFTENATSSSPAFHYVLDRVIKILE